MTSNAVSDGRIEQRTNMFVMASMLADTGACPVKMRNLSSRGALVEGAALPRAGSKVRLCRGTLSIEGQVVWSDGARAGLRFESLATVPEWLPRSQVNTGQQRVDDMIQRMKTSGWTTIPGQDTSPVAETSPVTANELLELKAALESLAEDLSEDAAVVERLAAKLQTLDIAAQTLGKLARSR